MPTRFPIAVICAATLVHSVYAADGTPDNSHALPSRQQVVAFLIETIDWYRHLSAVQQTVAEPADILFLEDSRAVGTQVVRFSFDFAKALAAFEATPSAPTDPGSGRKAPLSPDFQHLQAMETQSETETQQAAADLNTLKTKRIAAWGPGRKQLDAEIADTQSRLELLRAISASFQNLLDFAEAANAGPTQAADLEAFVESLERTVPEVSASGASSGVLPRTLTSAADQRASGILGLISGVSSFARRRRAIYEAIQRTDNLLQTSHDLQTPLSKPLAEALRNPELLAGSVEAADFSALQAQEARLKALTTEATQLSPAIAALTKQRVLLTLCETHLSDWRASIASQYDNAWKKLVFALASLTAAIAFLVAAGVLFGRFTAIHIHDANSRRTILIGQRLALWLALILIVLFAFAFDLSSMATFLGLVSAGIAVAMQNVILAVAGYFLLVGKLRIRVGDLVQISGVTGEVVDIGLMQFQLKELDTAGEQPTGRVVSFSNSFVFVSPATGLFKRIQAPASS